jgi:hypothetical protein
MQLKSVIVAAALVVSGCAASPPSEEDLIFAPDDSVDAERCINLALVTETDVINDRNIVFVMRSRDMYRNVLPRQCEGLYREQAFTYRTTLGRICENDLITVLTNLDFGDLSGPLCKLGRFYPISRPELEALEKEAELIREYGIEADLDLP